MDECSSKDDNVNAREPSCFVCDDEIPGRSYTLASCKTQHSRTRVIEKLGELVGERYMLMISEDDVICRSCVMLVSTLDRLEQEMHETRNDILRRLERKYSLKDGELCSDKPKPCQPPQITKSGVKENDKPGNESCSKPDDSKKSSSSWLQCDKCKYTTRLNSSMLHHLRDHIKQRSLCGEHSSENLRHNCNKDDSGNKENEADNSSAVIQNDTVKMIISNVTPTTPSPLTDLSKSNMLSMSDSTSSQQYVLQSTDMTCIDNPRKKARLDLNPAQGEVEVKDRGDDRKRILALQEDGSLQMVEITLEKDAKY